MNEMDSTVVLYYVILTGFSSVVFLYIAVKALPELRKFYLIPFLANCWSAVFSFSMHYFSELKKLKEFALFLPQYSEWIFTTPLSLVALLSLAMYKRPKDKNIYLLLALNITMIFTAAMADYHAPLRYLWYGSGIIPYTIIQWILWFPVRHMAQAQRNAIYKAYLSQCLFLSISWSLYPVTWICSPLGFGIVNTDTSILFFTILNIITKIGYFALYTYNLLMLHSKH